MSAISCHKESGLFDCSSLVLYGIRVHILIRSFPGMEANYPLDAQAGSLWHTITIRCVATPRNNP